MPLLHITNIVNPDTPPKFPSQLTCKEKWNIIKGQGPGIVIGRPKSTECLTVVALEALDMVGLYLKTNKGD